jgi:lysophospholipase L1-like esterase
MRGFRLLTLLGVVAIAACTGRSHASPSNNEPAGDGSAPAAPSFKSYVILGDSVSDRGGTGPFFYDLLGDSLKKRFGTTVVKGARGGATSSELIRQVGALPAELPGPVAVSVTIGGNDMLTAIENLPNGTDSSARAAFGANLVKAYDELTREGRFGAGVKVTIFHATIYDPSDGDGNFADAGCPGQLRAFPKASTKATWNAWNSEAKSRLTKYGNQAHVIDVYAHFLGHGVSKLAAGSSWYASDCIHPNTTGHAELKNLFGSAIAPM